MDTPEETEVAHEEAQARKLRRRRFLKLTGGALTLAAAGGVAWLATGPRGAPLKIADAFAALDRLEGMTLTSRGEWTPYRIFAHAAQSVEMSMSGYPEHKSSTFKNTIGSTAFSIFRKTGRMRHSLSEPIPGAPAIETDGDVALALQRLRIALGDFDAFEGDLAPHFAYGALSKTQYAAAHVLHLNNHLIEITT